MIRYSNNRKENTGYDYGTTSREMGQDDAILSLLKYEMGFGGKILSLSDTRIEVQTRVLSKVDTVTFEGSADEMRLVLQALGLWVEARKRVSDDEIAERILKITGGNPLLITMGADIFVGDMVAEQILDMLTAPGKGCG